MSVPIQTIPGVAGFAPALSLEYDSGRGTDRLERSLPEDTVGYGWRLAGLSQIRRCVVNQTSGASIHLNNTDSLCLDGMPLVLASGTHFAAGATYRTLIETYVKVKANVDSTGSLWFEATLPDGTVRRYGGTKGSHVDKNGGVDYQWSVSQETSVDGTTIKYTYWFDPSDGVNYVLKIDYASAAVDFEYLARSDTSPVSIGGVSQTQPVFLHTVRVSYNGKAVREYRLISEVVDSRRRLSKVQHCGYNEAGTTVTCLTPITGYGYGAGTAGPHAVTSATIAGTGITLTYDANGAVTTYDIAGTAEDRYLAYNAWNQPTKIVIGDSLNDATPTAKDEFAYDPDGRRYARKTTWKDGSNTYTETVAYVGAVEIISDNSSGSAETVTKVRIGPNAMWVKIQGSSTQTFYEYAHRDHLSSIEVVTDGNGNALDRLAFEPFGMRKAKNWTSNIPVAERDALLDLHSGHSRKARGFTGHEHLDRTGFVHANGRLYDPVLGRFLSPDPVVQAPGYSQSWNRYTYAFNSPASLVDPSGFDTTQPSDDELPKEPVDTVTVIGHATGSGSIGGGSAIHFGHVGGGFSIDGAAGPRPTGPANGGEGNACLWASVECWVTVDPFMTVHAKKLWGPSNAMPIVHGAAGAAFTYADQYRLALVAERANDNSSAGHVFIGGIKPDGSTEAYGFYPKERNLDALYVGKELEGDVRNDSDLFNVALEGDKNFRMRLFPVNASTYESAMDYIKTYDQRFDYSLFTNSCVHAALNTLYHAGLHQTSVDTWYTWGWTPDQAYELLEQSN